MKRVGILVSSTICSRYCYETIKRLSESNEIELFFLINQKEEETQGIYKKIVSMVKQRGIFNFFSFIFFRIVTKVEYIVLSSIYSDLKKYYEVLNIDEFQKNSNIYLNPIFSKSRLSIKYSSEDIKKLESLELDLIIRGNVGVILKGKILSVSKDGILSFHHGDNRWNRGGPAGFWEVYKREASTGFIIQVLSEELDGGAVIFRSNIPTKRSYIENISFLYQESYPSMSNIVLKYAVEGYLAKPEKNIPYSGTILRVPTPLETISYSIRTFFLFIRYFVNYFPLQKRDRWSVSFVKKDYKDSILRKGIEIKNPSNRFFADPFVITKGKRTICFVEDYSYSEKLGSITAIEIFNEKEYKILGTVIKEPFHLSFPYLFEYKDELYMVPESSKDKSIRLYKCIDFPLKWEYQKNLFDDINATDSMIFEYEERWWLLFTISHTGQNYCSELVAFYTKSDPINGKWIAHKKNPLITDSRIARNAGILGGGSRTVVRGRQKQGFNIYGNSLTLAEIIDLTPSLFDEKEIAEINPNFFSNLKGCHHIHSDGIYTVYDYFHNKAIK